MPNSALLHGLVQRRAGYRKMLFLRAMKPNVFARRPWQWHSTGAHGPRFAEISRLVLCFPFIDAWLDGTFSNLLHGLRHDSIYTPECVSRTDCLLWNGNMLTCCQCWHQHRILEPSSALLYSAPWTEPCAQHIPPKITEIRLELWDLAIVSSGFACDKGRGGVRRF